MIKRIAIACALSMPGLVMCAAKESGDSDRNLKRSGNYFDYYMLCDYHAGVRKECNRSDVGELLKNCPTPVVLGARSAPMAQLLIDSKANPESLLFSDHLGLDPRIVLVALKAGAPAKKTDENGHNALRAFVQKVVANNASIITYGEKQVVHYLVKQGLSVDDWSDISLGNAYERVTRGVKRSQLIQAVEVAQKQPLDLEAETKAKCAEIMNELVEAEACERVREHFMREGAAAAAKG